MASGCAPAELAEVVDPGCLREGPGEAIDSVPAAGLIALSRLLGRGTGLNAREFVLIRYLLVSCKYVGANKK